MAPISDAETREAACTLPVYPHLPIEPVSAAGCFLHTADGREILDFYGGHAVTALGYDHPALVSAIEKQLRTLLFQSNMSPLAVRARAAEKLAAFAPPALTRVLFVNSGAEANENALRLACLATGRRKVVAVEHAFHGRSTAAAAVTWGSRKRWYAFPQLPFEVIFVPRDDAEAAAHAVDDETAAVIAEPVQGVAGAYDLAPAFLQALAGAAKSHGAVFIADEVQSGMGRSGLPFAIQHAGVEPDIVTAAKSLGGGFPCGALLATEALAAELRPGDLGTTFGGGPVAAAAIEAVVDTIAGEDLMTNVREREAQIRSSCLTGPVTAIQGRGLLLGLRCAVPAARLRDALLSRDILTGTSGDPAVLRLLPPFVIGAEHVRRLAAALADIGNTDLSGTTA
jgi:acetylornithine/succinyldiaminopimelate/putrescine aminotransferase